MAVAEHIPNHTIDPTTGFLESNAYPNTFNAERKALFLEAFKSRPYHPAAVCVQLGISFDTFRKHLSNDHVFKESVRAIKENVTQEIEQVLINQALDPKKTVDRIFALKALRPEMYNPVQYIHQDTTYKIIFDTPATFLDKEKTLKKTIDAEIVSTPNVELQTIDSQRDASASNDTPSPNPPQAGSTVDGKCA